MMENEGCIIRTAPDGRELVTIGTPEFPVGIWGPTGLREGVREIAWHWHDEWELNIAMEEGEVMMADGKTVFARPGQGMFINSGVLHGAKAAQENGHFRHCSIVFHPSLVGGASGSVFWQQYVSPVLRSNECRCVPLLGERPWQNEVLEQAMAAVRSYHQKRPGYEFEVRAALSRVVLLLAQNCITEAPPVPERELRDAERIKVMVDFIRTHSEEPLTTEQIARSAAISVSECLRCFRRMMDLTPKEYLRQHRIRHAATLLEQTHLTVTQIGERCGFEDMSYFARVFRAEKGCTPSQYREQVLAQ